MIRQLAESKLRRPIAQFMALLMMNFAIPANLYAYDPSKPVELKEEVQKQPASRALTAKEMKSMRGRTGGNPYYAGQAKFDVVYKGVNLRTGNYSTSATDLSFEGGYGIPVNVTRSYSANSIDEGPLGVGWNLSADLRSTAGGLLKSASAPVRSVPVGMKRRPSTEVDPNVPTQPIEAVIVTDADGKETTIQRDVDGILTTPPWDKNEYETEYEYVTLNNQVYWILKSNKTMTPDGTVYQYEKKGSYVNGSKPWNDSNATAEPNNVLKPIWVEDRHGNKTNYTYGNTDVQFSKANGLVAEKPLIGVDMPNGRSIEFLWTGNRITQVRAYSSNEERSVLYGYTNGQLTSIQNKRVLQGQSPEFGRITRYGYSGGLLTSITDPRGNTLGIEYYYSNTQESQRVKYIAEQGDRRCYFGGPDFPWEAGLIYSSFTQYYTAPFVQGSVPTGDEPVFFSITSGPGTIVVKTDMSGPGTDSYLTELKVFNALTLDLVETQTIHNPPNYSNTPLYSTNHRYASKKLQSYNFLGNPLKDQSFEYDIFGGIWNQKSITTTETAYWGEEKFFQQRAVKVTATRGSQTLSPRYSFTDYFDNQASQGLKGQTKQVHDTANGGIYLDTNATVPSYASAYAWKYQITANPAMYSAKFEYDSKGRPVKVWKLQRTSPSREYVRTDSTYGADNAPAYGNATTVVEDAGGPGARTTQTLAFDLLGKAIQTQDAMGRVFSTNYDPDGNILSVTHGAQPVVTYTYGTVDQSADNGQPLTIVDGLSGVSQSISYDMSTTSRRGLPVVIEENVSSSQNSSVAYTYNTAGERLTSTLTTPNGQTRYRYDGYHQVGLGTNPTRVFNKIVKQELNGGNWVDSLEEVRYKFEYTGRLKRVEFGPTPQDGQTNYSLPAKSFFSAEYEHDAAGRTTAVRHYWNQLNGSIYQREAIRGATAAYNHALGLKTSTSFQTRQAGGSDVFSTVRTETYAYDPHFDYLTGVSYNDGLANANQNWTYDAAGNRISDTAQPGTWSYDNLNRMTASPGATYGHDVVGNRLSKSAGAASATYTWDAVNRMVGYQDANDPNAKQYIYRSDGMRVKEVGVLNGSRTNRHFYDGQMPCETDEAPSSTGVIDKVTRNFVGARGIEAMFLTQGGSTTTSYPLYDVHGNMVATVAKGSSGTSWTIQDERSYDVWGSVRSGTATGGPRGRYCANLGHVQDDESGLVYMRARYYEPGSGRFLSEDPARDGVNWYVYAGSKPNVNVDSSGRCLHLAWCGFGAFVLTFTLTYAKGYTLGQSIAAGLVSAVAAVAAGAICNAVNGWAIPSEMAGIAALGTKFCGSGFVSMVAQFMIDVITGDEPGMDLLFAFCTGGFGGLLPSFDDITDAAVGAAVGGGGNALWSMYQGLK